MIVSLVIKVCLLHECQWVCVDMGGGGGEGGCLGVGGGGGMNTISCDGYT